MVSIIVPVYNCEDRIRKCIESIIRQSYRNIEVLLVDDGSTDASGRICDEYAAADKRVCVYHQKNAGASAARNKGIILAKGEYIQFVDSDDYIAEDMTERLVESIKQNGTSCSICGYVYIRGRQIQQVQLQERCSLAPDELERECPGIFGKNILNPPWNKLYIREEIDSYFDETLSLGEDLLFNLAYLKKIKRISFVGGCPYHYIEKEASLTKQYRADLIQIAERLYKASIKFILENRLGEKAVNDAGGVFIKSVIYGCYDICVVSKMSVREKKKEIICWLQKKTVQTALTHSALENMQQRMAAFLLRKQYIDILMFFNRIKQVLSYLRNRKRE